MLTRLPNVPSSCVQGVIRALCRAYMVGCHRLETDVPDGFPHGGPLLAIVNHSSNLDAVAYAAADPSRPPARAVAKESLLRVPVVNWLMSHWGAIPVTRDGHDVAALRSIVEVLRQGHRVAVAAEGTRSRDGHLGPLNRVLVKLVVDLARRNVPIVLGVAIGTHQALPPGTFWPRPTKVRVVLSLPIDLSPWAGQKIADSELEAVGTFLQASMAAMLPPDQRPQPGTPALTPQHPVPASPPAQTLTL